MSEMVERVAAALALRGNPPSPRVNDKKRWPRDFTDFEAACYRQEARAAIEAMRWPLPDSMMAAGGTAEPFGAPMEHWKPGEIVAGTVWRAMIDEALKD